MKKTSQLRELIAGEEIVVIPGVYSALPAVLAERVGFSAVYMSGFTTAAFQLGLPDLGLITMTEMAENAKRICDAVDIPVIADCDNGYGNPVNVTRTIKEFEKAGVAAIQLEDQVFSKKCGHMTDKEIIGANKMVKKIEAAVDTRKDEDLVIIARTDARTVSGFDEAITRGNMYVDAGADVIFIESPMDEEELRKVPELIKAPVVSNMVEKGKTPLFSNQKLQEMGYKLAIWPGSSAWATAKATLKTMQELKDKGTTQDLIQDDMIAWEDFNDLVKVPEYLDLSEKYQE